MRIATSVLVVLAIPALVAAQKRPPILDVHLHARSAGSQGPPPVAMCTAIDPMPVWDPQQPFGATFMALLKKPPCHDPVWSPTTDEALMHETLAVMERLNIFGVVSGPAERVAAWRAAAPGRLIPALELRVTDATPSPEALRALHARGELAVLGK